MIDTERIAKLQALLERVQSRSHAPRRAALRTPPARPSVLEDVVARASLPSPIASAPPPPLPAITAAVPPAVPPLTEFFELPSPSLPPSPPAPPTAAPAPPAPPSPPVRPKHAPRPEVPAGLFSAGRLEPTSSPTEIAAARNGVWSPPDPPPMEVIELEVDPDPSLPPPPFDDASFEDTRPGDLAPVVSFPAPLESRSRLVVADAIADESPAPLESEPPAPASDPTIEVAAVEVSQREIEALEEELAPSSSRRPISLEEKMSEVDDAPLHAAPPESGSLPAAVPAIDLAFEREAEAEAKRTHAEPDVRAQVAVFLPASPPAPAAKTFGELLDAALSL